MKTIEKFAELTSCTTETNWRNKVFRLSREMGFNHTLLSILPGRESKPESKYAYMQSNVPSEWRAKYDAEKLGYIDPTVSHCMSKSLPLIWAPGLFSSPKQKALYEEASSYGLRSGVTLPIHGADGEIGMLYLVSDAKPSKSLNAHIRSCLPELAYFRDFICETSHCYTKRIVQAVKPIRLTKRELECLKLCAIGKSSWEIAVILNCTESAVNFHFTNIRSKFNTNSRSQALVMAIQLGMVDPS